MTIRVDAVEHGGTALTRGEKNMDRPNNTPHVTVDSPVFAPTFIPAADSGVMRNGGPCKSPLRIHTNPQTINVHRDLGVVIFGLVSCAREERGGIIPPRVRIEMNARSSDRRIEDEEIGKEERREREGREKGRVEG
jgi:hypothetical protein